MQEQFSLAAITDHDRVDTVVALQQLAKERHIPLIPGVEMTTLWKDELSDKDEMSGLDKMTDLLCYGFGPPPNRLNDLAKNLSQRQCENTRKVFERSSNSPALYSHMRWLLY